MTSRQWIRRVVVGSALPLFVALITVALLVGGAFHDERRRERAATSTATGTIAGVHGDKVDVDWRDAAGRSHQTRFELNSGHSRDSGEPFALHYDPAQPQHAYADKGEDPYPRSEDLDGARTVTWLGVGLLGLLVAVRLLLWRRARRRPLAAALALPLTLRQGLFQVICLPLWPPDAQPGERARAAVTVTWVPHLRQWGPDPAPVEIHGALDHGRIRALRTPVGELLGLGRVRRKKLPGGAVLPPLPVHLPAEAIERDESGFPVVHRPWWWAPLAVLSYAAAVITGAVVFQHLRGLPLAALLLLGPTAAVWAWGTFAISPDRPGPRDDSLLSGVDLAEREEDALARISREVDLSLPRRIVHELTTTSEERAASLAGRVRAAGYEVEMSKVRRGSWAVSAAREVVVDEEYLKRAKRELESIALLHAETEYDGWWLDVPEPQ